MAVSKRLRYEVLKRDNHTCRYCGGTAPDVKLTIDHVVPTTLGGDDDPGNLVTACADCNSGKSSSNPDAPLVAQVQEDMLRWREAMVQAYYATVANRELRDSNREYFLDAWNAWTWEDHLGKRRTFELSPDWVDTVDRFVSSGLMGLDFDEAIGQTFRRSGVRDRFKYFCGVCWNMVTERQKLAAAYLREVES